jgi:hypothetical protein
VRSANIRAVNRLRAFSNEYLLPLLLGALVLRALIPAGFMPGTGAGFSLTAMLCNAPATGVRFETIEIPGTAVASHCDYCMVPVLGTGFTAPTIQKPIATSFRILPQRLDAPHSRFALQRAQIPRAPPLA